MVFNEKMNPINVNQSPPSVQLPEVHFSFVLTHFFFNNKKWLDYIMVLQCYSINQSNGIYHTHYIYIYIQREIDHK